MVEENCDEPQAKRARKAEQGARTGSAKACQKTKLKRQHQLESIISRIDASAYEQCADMVEHMYITVKKTNGLGLTMVCSVHLELVCCSCNLDLSCVLCSADVLQRSQL